jgi:soluble lytic murein transglycosylase-like protein
VLGDGLAQSVDQAAQTENRLPAAVSVRLDREQSNIARYIASRYRTTLETTNQFVFHAYQAARDAKIDPMLVLAVMSVESSFDPRAQSSAGAQGLMQVLTRVHAEKFLPFGGIPAAFDPVANIRVGSGILKEYLKREGTVEGALKSYVGAAFLQDDGGYGQKVLNARDRIAAAAAGRWHRSQACRSRPAPSRHTSPYLTA